MVAVNGFVTLDAATGEQVGEVEPNDGTPRPSPLFTVDRVTVSLTGGVLTGSVE